jgi:spore coat protein A
VWSIAAGFALALTPFVDPLPRLKVATPSSPPDAGGAARYTLSVVELSQRLHRDLPPTRVWGFDDGTGPRTPGPTIEARRGVPVRVTWRNDLRDASGALRTTHLLPVDTCVHGADGAARTVIHLHGGHVPASSDGYPEATLLPGQSVDYDYPNAQLPATLFYHDHAMGITRLNVYAGLAGVYLLRDDVEEALGLPSGEYELALVLQDRTLRADGSLVYPAEWMDHFLGEVALVNGVVWPVLEVKRGKYRFRLVNGAGTRTFTLSLSDGAPLVVLGSDGGLLPAPVTVTSLSLAPGERADVVVDFAGYAAGTTLFFVNDAPAVPNDGALHDVMKLVVGGEPGHVAPLPSVLRPLAPLQPAGAAATRDLVLEHVADPCGGGAYRINGLGWDDVVERPVLGTTEIWRFINRTGVSHPMHLHLVMFQVLDRQPFTVVGGAITPSGPPVPPAAHLAGWKDTVAVAPGEIVRVVARFEDFAGRFPYHCHVLEHEDHAMMRTFETVSPATLDLGAPDAAAAVDDLGAGEDLAMGEDLAVAEDLAVDDGGRARDGGGANGCGCRVGGRGGDPTPIALLLALAGVGVGVAARRRQRRAAQR